MTNHKHRSPKANGVCLWWTELTGPRAPWALRIPYFASSLLANNSQRCRRTSNWNHRGAISMVSRVAAATQLATKIRAQNAHKRCPSTMLGTTPLWPNIATDIYIRTMTTRVVASGNAACYISERQCRLPSSGFAASGNAARCISERPCRLYPSGCAAR